MRSLWCWVLMVCARTMGKLAILTKLHGSVSLRAARVFRPPGDGAAIHNLGGKSGAWLSDLLLMLFGVSAWWWVLLALAYVIHTFRHLDENPLADSRQRWVRLGRVGPLLLVP